MTSLGPEGSTHVVSRASSFTLGGIAFGPWQLDIAAQCLWRGGVSHQLTPLQFSALHLLVINAGSIVTKQALLKTVWGDVAVGDNSVERMLSDLRALLDPGDRRQYIQTLPRRGYLFVVPTSPIEPARHSDVEALLEPFRACFEGRIALETLTRDAISRARRIYHHLVTQYPDRATYHVGLAIACVLTYESTRADPQPDREALAIAAAEGRQACELSPKSAEASATLGVILGRLGDRVGAIVALQRACTLEPENWLHLCRLAEASWGQARTRAARHALRVCPGFPMAHWFVASTLIANRRFREAETEIDAAIKSFRAAVAANSVRFLSVALYYVKGLLCLARGAVDEALEALAAELALEPLGHFYARECCANVWYIKGALLLQRGDLAAARAAFQQALARVAAHPLALAGLEIVERREGYEAARPRASSPQAVAGVSKPSSLAFEHAMARAALLVDAGDVPAAADLLLAALRAAPEGNSGWWIGLDPLLRVWEQPEAWEPVLQAINTRAL
jgi:DNA-binding winged helix-turn-helix (wHTH) protein/tetratricopeptide (TPR) repeat protein